MSRIVYFIGSYALWLLLTLPPDREHLIAGVVVCAIAALVFGETSIADGSKFLQPKRYLWFVIYILVLFWECLKANLDVAYRVLAPAMPIRPGIIKTRSSLQTDVGRTWLANSITMTPGTISVDIKPEGEVYIHWINVRTDDMELAKEMIFGKFERILRRVFE